MSNFKTGNLYEKYPKALKEKSKLANFLCLPPLEVQNILMTLDLDFSNTDILEPTCGGGHMLYGIMQYIKNKGVDNYGILGTDIAKRRAFLPELEDYIKAGEEYDYLTDKYPITSADYVIMFPPYISLEAFLERSFEIAEKGILCLTRLPALEGASRFVNIYENNPPSDIYAYIDRLTCGDNGLDILPDRIIPRPQRDGSHSPYAFLWMYWDRINKTTNPPRFHWIKTVQ